MLEETVYVISDGDSNEAIGYALENGYYSRKENALEDAEQGQFVIEVKTTIVQNPYLQDA